jgi:WD40 repeat protein
MMKKSQTLSFRSPNFVALPLEDQSTNPGVYGQSLATWLSNELQERGIPTRKVIPEDFGWCIPIVTTPHRTYVACASADETCQIWNIFVFSEGGLLARLVGKDSRRQNIDRTFSIVHSILSASPIIQDLK